MNWKNRIFFLLCFLIFSIFWGNELNLKSKKISFSLDKRSGGFFIENPFPSRPELKNLLFKDNPPTSFVVFYLDGVPIKISDKKFTVEEPNEYDGYIKASLKYKKLLFNIYFILTNIVRDYIGNSVIIGIEALNEDTNQHNVEVRFLVDTVYGENKKNPSIFTSSRERITYDKIIPKEMIPEFFFSGEVDPIENYFYDGLYIYPYINEIKPEKVIVGNWKKLYIMRNFYIPEPKAGFKYNPYSDPDAAIYTIYKLNIATNEKVYFGITLSVDRIPPEKLKIHSSPESILTYIAKEKPKEEIPPPEGKTEEKTTEFAKESTEKSVVEIDTNRLLLIKAQLSLIEKLSALLDKIESKFFSTNSVQFQKPSTTVEVPRLEVIVPESKNTNLQLLEEQLRRLQEEYIQKLSSMQRDLEKKPQIEEKSSTVKKSKASDRKKEIDEALKEVDRKIYFIEKLMKISSDIGNLPQEKIQQIEKEVLQLEREADL